MVRSFTVPVPGGQMFITAAERFGGEKPVEFVTYDAAGNHGDSIRCHSCYLGFTHSTALHLAYIAEYQTQEHPDLPANWE